MNWDNENVFENNECLLWIELWVRRCVDEGNTIQQPFTQVPQQNEVHLNKSPDSKHSISIRNGSQTCQNRKTGPNQIARYRAVTPNLTIQNRSKLITPEISFPMQLQNSLQPRMHPFFGLQQTPQQINFSQFENNKFFPVQMEFGSQISSPRHYETFQLRPINSVGSECIPLHIPQTVPHTLQMNFQENQLNNNNLLEYQKTATLNNQNTKFIVKPQPIFPFRTGTPSGNSQTACDFHTLQQQQKFYPTTAILAARSNSNRQHNGDSVVQFETFLPDQTNLRNASFI